MWLAETDRPISVIATDAGFSNLSNFNRRFRAVRRMTPKEFRRYYLKDELEKVDLTKRSPSLETRVGRGLALRPRRPPSARLHL
jgi:AraC-like DNA-binding protein